MNLLRRSLLPHPLARPTRGLEEFFEFGKPHRVGMKIDVGSFQSNFLNRSFMVTFRIALEGTIF